MRSFAPKSTSTPRRALARSIAPRHGGSGGGHNDTLQAGPRPLATRSPVWDFGRIAVHSPCSRAVPADAGTGERRDGAPLPTGVRTVMEDSFGETLGDVRLHRGPAAHRAARAIGARAYTAGSDIVLGDRVSTAELNHPRSRLLAHELTHVLQHRRAGTRATTDRIEPSLGGAEREAGRNSWLSSRGLPLGPVRTATAAIALTTTSDSVAYDLSYAWNDWAVTAAEERRILIALETDPRLSDTVVALRSSGMLGPLFDRIDARGNRRRLLHILGRGLNGAARAIVEPYVRSLGAGAELQFNLAQFGVTSAAPAFNPAPLEAAVVGRARSSQTGFNGGFLTAPFTGVGATGVIPTTRYVGTFYTTPGVPQIPLEDKALLALGDAGTVATYSNPLGSLPAYLSGLSATQRTQQAELLLRRPIASVEASSYGGNLPSRAQVITAAARAHNLHGALVAAVILAEQRDQTQAEDAKDYQGATSIMRGNTSIGLGQVVVSTARGRDLFADLVSATTRRTEGLDRTSGPGREATATLLASDEYNIFAVARYIRQVADRAAALSLAALPTTAAQYPGLSLSAYAGNSSAWPDDNIRALGSEYTSTAWDDRLSAAWGEFVYQAYLDVRATGLV
jgi:hypothetical protein